MSKEEITMYRAEQKAEWSKYAELTTAIHDGEKKGLAKGRLEGLKEGRAEGLTAGKIEIAKAMLLKGMDTPMVADLTGLSTEDLKKL